MCMHKTCMHVRDCASDLAGHYEKDDHPHLHPCPDPDCDASRRSPRSPTLPASPVQLFVHYRVVHRGVHASLPRIPTGLELKASDKTAFLRWLASFGLDTDRHPTAEDVQRQV